MLNRTRRLFAAHLEMMRPYTMFHSGLVAVAGALVSASGHVAPWRVVLAALVTMCGWEAGLYAGDYYDRELDAHSKPDRPVPSGRVSPRVAFNMMVGLIALGYACAALLGWANLALAVATTVLGIAYSKAFKARAFLGNLDRGVLGVCAVLFGAFAAGHVERLPILALATLVFFHDSATNLIGAMRDVEGDRADGCPTVPVVYGLTRAVELACALALAWVAAALALGVLVHPGALALGLFALALAIDLGVYVPMLRAPGAVTRTRALRAHKYLVAERLVLSSAVITVYAPAVIGLGLLAFTLVASVATQLALRDRYERQRITPVARGTSASGVSHETT